jgi:hypothetical protein
MQTINQDLNIYFENLKKEFKTKSRKKNFIRFIQFSIFIQILICLSFYYSLNLIEHSQPNFNSTEQQMSLNTVFYLISGMGVFFSFFYWMSISMAKNVKVLNNNDNVNFYEALKYLYRNEKTEHTNNPEYFQNLIDSEYERERLTELLANVHVNKSIYAQKTSEINHLYETKQKLIPVTKVLKAELNIHYN